MWSARWLRVGYTVLLASGLVAVAVTWVCWMRASLDLPVEAGDTLGLRARVLLGASPTEWRRESDGATLLYCAVRADRADMVRYLVAHGADPNGSGRDGSPLCAAIGLGIPEMETGAELETIRALLACGADPCAAVEGGDTPLIRAVDAGRADVIAILAEAGADPTCRDQYGSPPILRALWSGRIDVVAALLDAGADIEQEADHGEAAIGDTALTAALSNGDLGMARFLLERGADVEHAPKGGMRPLLEAMSWMGQDAVALLLAHEADANPRKGDAVGPLHAAAERGDVELAAMLLDAGANPDAVVWRHGVEGTGLLTPLDVAATMEMSDLLRSRGASITFLSPLERLLRPLEVPNR